MLAKFICPDDCCGNAQKVYSITSYPAIAVVEIIFGAENCAQQENISHFIYHHNSELILIKRKMYCTAGRK